MISRIRSPSRSRLLTSKVGGSGVLDSAYCLSIAYLLPIYCLSIAYPIAYLLPILCFTQFYSFVLSKKKYHITFFFNAKGQNVRKK